MTTALRLPDDATYESAGQLLASSPTLWLITNKGLQSLYGTMTKEARSAMLQERKLYGIPYELVTTPLKEMG